MIPNALFRRMTRPGLRTSVPRSHAPAGGISNPAGVVRGTAPELVWPRRGNAPERIVSALRAAPEGPRFRVRFVISTGTHPAAMPVSQRWPAGPSAGAADPLRPRWNTGPKL